MCPEERFHWNFTSLLQLIRCVIILYWMIIFIVSQSNVTQVITLTPKIFFLFLHPSSIGIHVLRYQPYSAEIENHPYKPLLFMRVCWKHFQQGTSVCYMGLYSIKNRCTVCCDALFLSELLKLSDSRLIHN